MEIFDYSDFREYIKARIEQMRGTVEGFTFRSFAEEAGFKSPNFLKLVMDGKRNLSLDGARKMGRGLRLNPREIEYFENLVAANQAKGILERNDLSAKLMGLRAKYSPKPIQAVNYDYFKTWYNVLVREALLVESPKSLPRRSDAFRPKLSVKEVEHSLNQLLELGLITRTEDGRFITKEETVRTDDFFSNSALLSYHLKMMDLAKNSLTEFPGTDREIGALTLALSARGFVKVRELIKQFKAEVLAVAESELTKEDVYQLNIQMFPLSRGLKR
ncbi:MAG: TIGR02147 family protein [Bdellovibrionales bacterium]